MDIHWAWLVLGGIVALATIVYGFTTQTRSLLVAGAALVVTALSCVQIFHWWILNQDYYRAGVYVFVAWLALATGIRQFLIPYDVSHDRPPQH